MLVSEKIESMECPWQDEEVLRSFPGEMTQAEIADELGCAHNTVSKWMDRHGISTGWKEGDLPYERVALFSGGHDSLASTHYVMEELDGDVVVHIDTGTGIDDNQQFVEDVCEEYGWELEIITPNTTLVDFAKRWGFPKAPGHSWIYRYLKEHPLQSFARDCENKPYYFTGVRSDESVRRMETVDAEGSDAGQWFWRAPIADWTDEDVEEYIDEEDLPRNPVVEVLGRSGECFCGAFSDRWSELNTLEEHYPEHAEWIYEIEQEVQEDIGEDESHCYWATSGLTDEEVEQLKEQEDTPVLCSGCSPSRDFGGDS